MSLKRLQFVVLMFSAFFMAATAYAQKEFGAIGGRIADLDGEPIPGATVIASSPALVGGSSSAYTNQFGFYRFPALAPGTYEVSAELSGFQKVTRIGIRLFVGTTLTVDFVLEPQSVSEDLTVSAEPPLIDSTTTASSNVVPAELVFNLPEPRSIVDLLSLTPGVGKDFVAYGGAEEPANRIWVDGVDVSDPQNGGLYAAYNYNWIEEAQVTGIGAPAEYGGFSGIVGNFVTRSGGNQFHGLAEVFFHNEKLVATNTPDPGPESPLKVFDASLQTGGPIIKDKLWFFSGLQYPYEQSRPYGYNGIVTNEYPRFITKLTSRLDENNTLQGFVHYNYSRQDGGGADALTLPEATPITTCNQTSWNATWISLLSSRTTFEGRFGGFGAHCKDSARNGDTSARFDWATRLSSGNPRWLLEYRRIRPQVNAVLSHYADHFLGSHDFKFGAEIERSDASENYAYPGPFLYYDINGLPSVRVSHEPYVADSKNHRISTYAQDDWDIAKQFTLSLGVRWDHNRGLTNRGVVFSTDPVAPRIGFIWKLQEEGKTVLKAHYGDYYDALLAYRYYRLEDPPIDYYLDSFDPESRKWDRQYHSSTMISGGNIKQLLMRQFTTGADQELPGEIALGAHYIHRSWTNITKATLPFATWQPIPYTNPVTGETITVYNRTNPGNNETWTLAPSPESYRTYDGLEVILNRQFRNKLSLSGSIVFSKIKGNVPNIAFTSYPFFGTFVEDPNTRINFTGHLVNDPGLAWKVAGTYSFRWGINTGWFLHHESGDTWTPLIWLPYDLVNEDVSVFGLPRGAYRLPSQTLLDLRVEKCVPISHGELRFTVDIFNVFNSAFVTSVNDDFDSPTYSTPLGYTDPQSINLGLRYTF